MSEIDDLKALIDDSNRIAAFTGAGISTESGIPDFRSPGGVWEKNQPIEFSDFMSSKEMRRESWRRRIRSDGVFAQSQPNAGHRALAELVKRGKSDRLITQNVDGLHQASGIPDECIIELHGNATYCTCLNCGKRYELDEVLASFQEAEEPPICDACEGIIKTATISFGQAMPEHEMERAQEATLGCDLFIAIGSSLVVYPAAGFPQMAKQNGAKLVILNRDETPLDGYADLVVNAEIGASLSAAVGLE
jgi:NAD-dependent deacetylase